jgi:hypothetical protein
VRNNHQIVQMDHEDDQQDVCRCSKASLCPCVSGLGTRKKASSVKHDGGAGNLRQ